MFRMCRRHQEGCLHVGVEDSNLVLEGQFLGVPYGSQGVECVPCLADLVLDIIVCTAILADYAPERCIMVCLLDVLSL